MAQSKNAEFQKAACHIASTDLHSLRDVIHVRPLSHCRLYASICRAGMLANEGNACGRYQEDLASTCVILLPWLTVSILA